MTLPPAAWSGADLRGEGADGVAAVLPLRRAAGLRDEEGQRVVLQAGRGQVGGHVPGVRRGDLQVGRGVVGGQRHRRGLGGLGGLGGPGGRAGVLGCGSVLGSSTASGRPGLPGRRGVPGRGQGRANPAHTPPRARGNASTGAASGSAQRDRGIQRPFRGAITGPGNKLLINFPNSGPRLCLPRPPVNPSQAGRGVVVAGVRAVRGFRDPVESRQPRASRRYRAPARDHDFGVVGTTPKS